MKRMKKVGAVILAICVTFCIVAPYLSLWAGITLLSMKSVDAEPSIDRPDEINDYDPKVKIEEAGEDVLLDGIDYEMAFLQYDNRYGTAKPIENLNHEITEDEESYKVALRVKNNTAEELSGARFFIKLPDSVGEQSVVGDEMTLTAQLEYGGAVAQRQLNLTDEDSPIAVVFPSGAAGYIWKGDAEAERLPVYEEDAEILPFDYWQDEGLELNVPAGEEWQLYVSVQAKAVTDFQVKTKILSADGEYSGKKLSTTTVFGRKKLFHVVTEIANPTEIEESIEIWTYFDAGVNLVPGSVRLNGEQVEDFAVQEDQDDDTNFEVVNLGIICLIRL